MTIKPIIDKFNTMSPKQKAVVLGGAAIGSVGLAIMAGGVLATGVVVSGALILSTVFTMKHLPTKVKDWLFEHPLITNTLATTGVGMVVGVTTVTGLVVTAFTFLGIDVAQRIAELLRDPVKPGNIVDVDASVRPLAASVAAS